MGTPSKLARQETVWARGGILWWLVRPAVIPAWARTVLEDPDAALSKASGVVADTPLITMARIPPPGGSGPSLCLRRLNYGRSSHRLRDVFRNTRAERAFWNGLELEHAGVKTPKVFAAGFERKLRWPIRAYLLTEWIADAETLEQRLQRDRSLNRPTERQLAKLLATLHQNGFSHRDLKSSNVVFDQWGQPNLIDLDGVRHFGHLPSARAIADLSRFAWEFARYPLLLRWGGRRFLESYFQERGLQEDRRSWDPKIARPVTTRLAVGIDYWKR